MVWTTEGSNNLKIKTLFFSSQRRLSIVNIQNKKIILKINASNTGNSANINHGDGAVYGVIRHSSALCAQRFYIVSTTALFVFCYLYTRPAKKKKICYPRVFAFVYRTNPTAAKRFRVTLAPFKRDSPTVRTIQICILINVSIFIILWIRLTT